MSSIRLPLRGLASAHTLEPCMLHFLILLRKKLARMRFRFVGGFQDSRDYFKHGQIDPIIRRRYET